MERVRRQNPLTRPLRRKRSPKPLCHALNQEIRDRFRKAYRAFREMYRRASALVKAGKVAEAVFPQGSFPPSLPFTRRGEIFDPLADCGGLSGLAFEAAASMPRASISAGGNNCRRRAHRGLRCRRRARRTPATSARSPTARTASSQTTTAVRRARSFPSSASLSRRRIYPAPDQTRQIGGGGDEFALPSTPRMNRKSRPIKAHPPRDAWHLHLVAGSGPSPRPTVLRSIYL